MTVKIYSYGSSDGPLAGRDRKLVDDQLFLAWRYRNGLVEIERERRKRVDTAMAKFAPGLAEVEAAIVAAEATLEQARRAKSRLNAKARTKVKDPASREAVKAASQVLRDLRARRKAIRATAFADPAWVAVQNEIEAWCEGTILLGKTRRVGGSKKDLRASIRAKGVGWGTLGAVDDSLKGIRKGAPPRFAAWRGAGRVAVQLQDDAKDGTGRKGLSVRDLLACEDTRLRLDVRPAGVWVPGPRQRRKLGTAVLSIRIGSNPDNSPVWVDVPFVLHRPLPADAVVKWCWLLRTRVGTHWVWRVQFTLDRLSWARDDVAGAAGTVGIDVGWRLMDEPAPAKHGWNKRLRVAVWRGSDGGSGELSLPPSRWTCKTPTCRLLAANPET